VVNHAAPDDETSSPNNALAPGASSASLIIARVGAERSLPLAEGVEEGLQNYHLLGNPRF
jgi:hypothetical protein